VKTNSILVGITISLMLVLPAAASEYTLNVFGNSNEDETINMQDLTYTELIILESKEQTQLADANHDGDVDILDVTQIELIIHGQEKELTVLDSADRTVTIPKPVEKIVDLFGSNHAEGIRALGAIDRIVGIDLSATGEQWYLGGPLFFPELMDLPVVGSYDDPNYEMIIDLDPDVVIMLPGFTPIPEEVQEILAPADIPVVALSFSKPEIFFQETSTMGYILDTEERAEEYINFFQSWTGRIDEVMEDLEPEEQKTVYFEAEAEYYSYGGAKPYMGVPDMVRGAGGVYIYDDVSEWYFEVDPEELLKRNPDVIFKGTSIGDFGYTLTDTSDFEEIKEKLVSRPEMSLITAVGNNEVYIISWGVAGGPRKIFGPVFMAKCVYPEKFEDLDPHDFIKEYLKEWQNIPYQGVYIYPYP